MTTTSDDNPKWHFTSPASRGVSAVRVNSSPELRSENSRVTNDPLDPVRPVNATDSRGTSIEPCGCLSLGSKSAENEDDRQRSRASSNWVVTLKFKTRLCHARLPDLKAEHHHNHRYHHRHRHHQRRRHHHRHNCQHQHRRQHYVALVRLAREVKFV